MAVATRFGDDDGGLGLANWLDLESAGGVRFPWAYAHESWPDLRGRFPPGYPGVAFRGALGVTMSER